MKFSFKLDIDWSKNQQGHYSLEYFATGSLQDTQQNIHGLDAWINLYGN